jgi:integrase
MVDRLRLQRLQQDLLGSLDRSTTVLCMQYARAVMRAAYADGRIGQDPTRGLKMPKVRAGDRDGRVTADMVPTTEEVLAIIEAAPGPYRAAIGLGIAGLRIGEVLGMTVDRVDLDTRQVTVDRQAQRGELVPTKNDKARTIGIPEMVADELRSHPRALHGGGLLFPARTGGLLWDGSFYERGWRPALAAAGLAGRFKFHALRHYCASTLLAEGAPITAVAGHLGDVVPTVMKVYAHWLRDDRALPTDVLDRVLGPRLRIVESILSPRQPSD